MIYGLSRWYLVECSLTAVVALAICILWESKDDLETWKLAALGFLCGVGLLLKFSFPLYVAVPLLYCVVKRPRAALRPKTLLALALPVAIVALPWYALHWRSALHTALDTGSVATMSQFVIGSDVYSFRVILNYLSRLVNAGSLYCAALPLLLVLVFKRLPPAARSGLKLCALWTTPILFLLLWRSREVRYAAPLYPALAVGLAVLIDAALSQGRVWRKVFAGALLVLPFISMLQVSFGFVERRQGQVYSRAYNPNPWPFSETLAALQRTPKPPGRQEESLLVGTDSSQFNADAFKLAAVEARLPFQVATTAYEKEWSSVAALLDWASFFVYVEGGQPTSDYFNVHRSAALREVRESGNFVELPLSRTLPDGGVLHVFENLSENGFVRTGALLPAAVQTISDSAVAFAGVMELSGVALEQKDGALEVQYRWRRLRPLDREYWCFTHILDPQDKVVGYLDHRILDGSPSMTAWKEGDAAVETIHYRSRALQSGETYRLRLGLYDRATGQRLAISASAFPLADGGTAAVVSGPHT
jgi:uncharacterized SAM-binding protein YcdF (DUF218 family)